MDVKYSNIRVKITDPISGKSVIRDIGFVKTGYKLFYNAQHLMLQLNRGERAFFDYLCEHMDNLNRVHINNDLKEMFKTFLSTVSNNGVRYTENSVTTYTKTLLKGGLILKATSRNSAVYIVNPKYVYNGSETDRTSYLKRLIELRPGNGLPIDKLLDDTLENILGTP